MRGALEEGVARGVDFSFADLRQAKLFGASLDGMAAVGATFWGADLEGADIGLADLRKTDMRCASLKDTCFAETNLSGSDMRGAYFSGTIVEGAVLDRIKASCPSFWELDLDGAGSVENAIFSHKGEEDIEIDPARWLVQGAGLRIVLNGSACLWRGKIYRGRLPNSLQKALRSLHAAIERFDAPRHSQIARQPIPKSVNPAKRI